MYTVLLLLCCCCLVHQCIVVVVAVACLLVFCQHADCYSKPQHIVKCNKKAKIMTKWLFFFKLMSPLFINLKSYMFKSNENYPPYMPPD